MHEDKAQGVVNRVQWPSRTTKVISFHYQESLVTLEKKSFKEHHALFNASELLLCPPPRIIFLYSL